jgi:D-alanyl-D-alanine carboxypeptidase
MEGIGMRMGRWGILLMITGVAGYFFMQHGSLASSKPKVDARAAILLDANTAAVYYESNADEPLAPASMSKMMTELLILEDVYSGKRKWTESVHISSYAANVPGSKIGIKPKDTFTLRELFEAMVVHSANDAAVALAEQDEAGYCFTGTAMRDERRLISVVMGTSDPDARFKETEKLFEYAFAR